MPFASLTCTAALAQWLGAVPLAITHNGFVAVVPPAPFASILIADDIGGAWTWPISDRLMNEYRKRGRV